MIVVISKQILLLMGISVFLAWIVAYLFMEHWLLDFPYHIGFKPLIYVVAATAAMIISMATVILLSYRAARTNPADILHYE